MKSKLSILFGLIILISIIISFFLPWINWGKLIYSGIDIPYIYRKTTKISNAVLFFTKKESPHLAFYIYIIPILAFLSSLFILFRKYTIAKALLFLSTLFGFILSLYMYYYLMSSKILKFSNAGVGLHLLCIVTLIGLFYSIISLFRREKRKEAVIREEFISQNDGD